MSRLVELSLSQLESREVPAAGLFADLVPGDWGSYPNNLTTSGDTLFFSAEGRPYKGTELWATDGTAVGTRLVKDINPGTASSNPDIIKAAGNGVIFFRADDGTGRNLWKSDGTTAGTIKVTGIPPQVVTDFPLMSGGVGWRGELYFVTQNPNTGSLMWAKTNGTGYTVLTQFNGTAGSKPFQLDTPMRVNGDRMELTWLDTSNRTMVWQSDGTAIGTHLQQTDLYGYDWAQGWSNLSPGVEVGSDKYVFASTPSTTPGGVWVGSGFSSAGRQLIKRFGSGTSVNYLTEVNGKAYFSVLGAAGSTEAGLWVSDGTAAGTHKLNIPVEQTNNPPWVASEFDGRALVQSSHANFFSPETYYLTDGTDAGTVAVPRPAGRENADWRLAGVTPPDAATPHGLLVFSETATDTMYRTDGTAAGTAMIDRTGLPPIPEPNYSMLWWNPDTVRTVSYGGPNRGVYFRGDVYYTGSTTTQKPELWRWDVDGQPMPTTSPPPKATATQVNDGSDQRSMVKTLTVKFDSAVYVTASGVTITDAGGKSVAFSQQLSTANGVTTLTITFPSGVGGSIADGRYTLKITAGAVTRQTGGTAMASDYTSGFTRLYGDVTGDGIYDRDVRMLVKSLLGQHEGDAGYRWDLDVNGDGVIDNTDELAAIRGWGKAV